MAGLLVKRPPQIKLTHVSDQIDVPSHATWHIFKKITSPGGGGGGGFGSEGSGGVSGETSPRTMFGVLFRSGVSGEM